MNKPENDLLKLNPSAVDVPYGIREPKEFKIWPLSVGDQLEMSKTIAEALTEFLSTNTDNDLDLVGFTLDIIRDNVVKIVKLVIDDQDTDVEGLLKEMTNDQLVNLCDLIYRMNYEVAAKNFKSLSAKLKPIFLSERPSPLSAPNMDISSKRSSESPSETEV